MNRPWTTEHDDLPDMDLSKLDQVTEGIRMIAAGLDISEVEALEYISKTYLKRGEYEQIRGELMSDYL